MLNFLNLFSRNDSDAIYFEPGQKIIQEGEIGHEFYVVLEGEADIVHDGKVLFSVGPGEIFGEMALIDNSPRNSDVIARTRCKLAAVNEKRFLFMVQQTPYFALSMMRMLSHRLRLLAHQKD